MTPPVAVHALRSLPMERLAVAIATTDPLSRAGLAAQLQGHPAMEVVDAVEPGEAGVVVVVADEVDEADDARDPGDPRARARSTWSCS